MHYKLYQITITRQSAAVAVVHAIGRSKDDAVRLVINCEQALGLAHQSISVERVDHALAPDQRDGLDPLLAAGPACMVSQCSIGWVAHVAPVQRLRLYRSADHRGTEIIGVAPNEDVAQALFTNTLLPATQNDHRFVITDVTDDDVYDHCHSIKRLLDAVSVGIAEFDEETETWFVW